MRDDQSNTSVNTHTHEIMILVIIIITCSCRCTYRTPLAKSSMASSITNKVKKPSETHSKAFDAGEHGTSHESLAFCKKMVAVFNKISISHANVHGSHFRVTISKPIRPTATSTARRDSGSVSCSQPPRAAASSLL